MFRPVYCRVHDDEQHFGFCYTGHGPMAEHPGQNPVYPGSNPTAGHVHNGRRYPQVIIWTRNGLTIVILNVCRF